MRKIQIITPTGITIIVGLIWGDEGKGIIVFRNSQDADIVARWAGGNNAGHTLYCYDPYTQKFGALVVHLLPSSLPWGKQIALGAGMVIDPFALINEVKNARSFDIDPIGRLNIDGRAKLVTIYHRVKDLAQEIIRGKTGEKIGTTGRGIGPSYGDEVDRCGIRMSVLNNGDDFEKILRQRLAEKGEQLVDLEVFQGLNPEDMTEEQMKKVLNVPRENVLSTPSALKMEKPNFWLMQKKYGLMVQQR